MSENSDRLEELHQDVNIPADEPINDEEPSSENEEQTTEDIDSSAAEGDKKEAQLKSKEDDLTEKERKRYQRNLLSLKDENRRYNEMLKKQQEELEKLKYYAQQSNQSAEIHYKNSIESRLKMMQAAKAQARENGDYTAMDAADIEIAKIIAEEQELNKYQTQQKMAEESRKREQQYQQQHQNQPQGTPQLNEDTQDWLFSNPWADPASEEYDEELAHAAYAHASALDVKYKRNGKTSKIMTRDYYNEIDRYMRDNFAEDEPKNRYPEKRTSPVSAVTRTGGGKPTNARINLTEQEKRIAKNCGMTNEEYMAEKEAIAKGLR
jgi:hypothetical protein